MFKRSPPCSTRRLRQALAVLCFVPAAAAAPPQHSDELMQAAAGFDKFFLHDMCTGQYPPQPDTCLHERLHQESFTFGGKNGAVYDVTLRIRGIFEPTTITGGDTPDPEHQSASKQDSLASRINTPRLPAALNFPFP